MIEDRLKYKEDTKYAETKGQVILNYQDLINKYPPLYTYRRKIELYEKSLLKYGQQKGNLRVSRCGFKQHNWNKTIAKNDLFIRTDSGFYEYDKDMSDSHRQVWYLNFADPELFGFYSGTLFAQDEMMTLEMPLLCSVREYLVSKDIHGLPPRTAVRCLYKYEPTPILIENVPQWIRVDTKPTMPDGTQVSIYGNNFAFANQEQIDAGITIMTDDVKCNVICASAPFGGNGDYTAKEIDYTLRAAFSAFEQTVALSKKNLKLGDYVDSTVLTVIHTGNWGCGAYGGNYELMYLIQMIASSAVGVNELVFHSPKNDFFDKAQDKFQTLQGMSLSECAAFLKRQKYRWGMSDGN